MAERKRTQEALQEAHDELEARVKERTAELASTNKELQAEVLDRKQTQKALCESERKFKELFENMSSCVAVYEAVDDGKDFVFTDLNRATEEAEDVQRKDLIGKRLLDVFPIEDNELADWDREI